MIFAIKVYVSDPYQNNSSLKIIKTNI